MSLPPDLPVVDHHCHLSPTGQGVEAARRFRDAGGTHLFLANQQYGPKVALRAKDYEDQFQTTERLAEVIERDVGVIVYPVVAPYPIDLIRASEQLGLAGAVELQRAALELAGRWVEEQRAVALGEVGRPHFPMSEEIRRSSEEVFRYALEVARDAGCPAVVHCEELTSEAYRDLAAFAARASFPLGKLVKHYAKNLVGDAERAGIVPSYLVTREVAVATLGQPGPWFWETDFLDDPKRPGAVLDLATVPRRAAAAFGADPAAADRLRVPFVEAIEAVYGFTPKAPQRGT